MQHIYKNVIVLLHVEDLIFCFEYLGMIISEILKNRLGMCHK